MEGSVNPRDDLLDAVEAASKEITEDLSESMLTRTVIITEWARPGRKKTLYAISLNSDGSEMNSWESGGFLLSILQRLAPRPRS